MPKQAVLALAVLAAATAGCEPKPGGPPRVGEGEHIACALAGASKFSRKCEVERAVAEGMRLLIVRHPNGAFRRFEVLTDGRGLAVADGAGQAALALNGDELEVAVGADRYRFPARHIGGNASRP